MAVGKFTVDYFLGELDTFREAMCTRGNSLDKLDKLFVGLFAVACRTREHNLPGWNAICVEWPLRRGLMEMHGIGVTPAPERTD